MLLNVKPSHSLLIWCLIVCLAQNKDGTYNGFIKVHLKLVRPVSVPIPRKGSASQEQAKGKRGGAVKRRTSFYLPKDTAKHLHISSRTRAQEVIQALLKKFTVIDNPAKFALFERTERHDQGMAMFYLSEFWQNWNGVYLVTSAALFYYKLVDWFLVIL